MRESRVLVQHVWAFFMYKIGDVLTVPCIICLTVFFHQVKSCGAHGGFFIHLFLTFEAERGEIKKPLSTAKLNTLNQTYQD